MTLTKLLFLIVFLLLPLLCFCQQRGMKNVPPEIQAEKRSALVIGNGAYKDAPLRNPVNDSRIMASTLRGLGFKVLTGENLGQKEMKKIIREFGQQIKSSGVGLFYYAGHGIQSNGRNYLIPIGAEITVDSGRKVHKIPRKIAHPMLVGFRYLFHTVALPIDKKRI